MPKGLKRYYGTGELHFITCSCYQRKRWLEAGPRRNLFLKILEEVRREHRFVAMGLRGHAGALSSADERAGGGESFDRDAECEAAIRATGGAQAPTAQ